MPNQHTTEKEENKNQKSIFNTYLELLKEAAKPLSADGQTKEDRNFIWAL